MQRIHRETRKKMFAHIEASLKSTESKKHYCEQHGIALATFYYWHKRYKAERSGEGVTDRSGGFIAINVEPNPIPESEAKKEPSELHFLFPNGVQVKCADTVNVQVLKTLINS